MADLTITAANVIAGATAKLGSGTAGAAITAGQPLYYDSTSGTYKPADSDASAATADCVGIALHAAATGQPLQFAKSGAVTIGATLTAGTAYYLSSNPGGICPLADVGTGERVVLLGLASSTSVRELDIQKPGVTL